MTKTDFLSKIEGLTEASPGTLTGSESLNELAGWDSLAVLSFIAFADSEFGVMTSAQQLTRCRTVADLAALFPTKIS